MGACYDEFDFKGTKQELFDYFIVYCKNAEYEDGHLYSGRLNMTTGLSVVKDVNTNDIMTFPDYLSAHTYIIDTAEKWQDALAVQYIDAKDNETVWLVGGSCSS